MVGLAPAGTGLATGPALAWIALLGAVALGCPNTQELMSHHWFSSDPRPEHLCARVFWPVWRPTPAWAVAGAVLLAAALGSLSNDSAFLYYQF